MTDLERDLRDRRVARYSLGPTMLKADLLGLVLAVAPFAVLPRISPGFLNGGKGALTAMAIIAGSVVVAMAAVKLARSVNVRWLEGALTRLRLDRRAYLTTLENQAFTASVVVTVELEGGATQSPDVSGLPGTTVEARAGTLRITSPVLSTSSFTLYGPRPHNGKLHRWFKDCADKVLTPLAASGAVRAVRTELR